jgi:effector-binding domain-containing protein
LLEAFKAISAYIKRENLQADGSAIVIYTATEDTGFQFQAAIPISGEPKAAPSGDIGIGKSPSGQALKFIHEGPYDAMDTTYELITNYLDEKKLESKELFIEEYVTDPLTTAEDKLIINVLVPLK